MSELEIVFVFRAMYDCVFVYMNSAADQSVRFVGAFVFVSVSYCIVYYSVYEFCG